jgi:hypothetical protein
MSDLQAERALAFLETTGQPITYRSFPQMGHSMHGQDPKLFAETLIEWSGSLPE